MLIPDNEKCSFSVAENELNKFDFGLKLRFLRKIVGYPICPVNVFSYRQQNNVALLLYFSIKIETNKQQLKKAKLKTNKRYIKT